MIELDAFVRSVAVSQGTPYAFFLGAGTSISSGLPSAQRCIWEWKRPIFLSYNPRYEQQFAELLKSERLADACCEALKHRTPIIEPDLTVNQRDCRPSVTV